jgi:hypothetical protein
MSRRRLRPASFWIAGWCCLGACLNPRPEDLPSNLSDSPPVNQPEDGNSGATFDPAPSLPVPAPVVPSSPTGSGNSDGSAPAESEPGDAGAPADAGASSRGADAN